MRNYYFLCLCSRCTNPQEDLEMQAAACPNCKCNEYIDIEIKSCQRCGTEINQTLRNKYYEVKKLTKIFLNSKLKDGNFIYFIYFN